jgi:uncharacterized protein YjbI with pentapeptide repeats
MASERALELLENGVEAWNEAMFWLPSAQSVDPFTGRKAPVAGGTFAPGEQPGLGGRARPDLQGADLKDRDLRGFVFEGVDLSRSDLAGADLAGGHLGHALLRESRLAGANLDEVQASEADLSGAVLEEASLREASLHSARLIRTSARRADLTAATLARAVLREADLPGARLAGASLSDADLAGANLFRADLRGSVLCGATFLGSSFLQADLRDCRCGGASFAGADLSLSILVGARATVPYRWSHLGTEGGTEVEKAADFSGARMIGADLRGAGFGRCRFLDADIRRANLAGAVLQEADLSGARFTGAQGAPDTTGATGGDLSDIRLCLDFLEDCDRRWRDSVREWLEGTDDGRSLRARVEELAARLVGGADLPALSEESPVRRRWRWFRRK